MNHLDRQELIYIALFVYGVSLSLRYVQQNMRRHAKSTSVRATAIVMTPSLAMRLPSEATPLTALSNLLAENHCVKSLSQYTSLYVWSRSPTHIGLNTLLAMYHNQYSRGGVKLLFSC